VSRPQPAAWLIVTLDVHPGAVLLDVTEHDLAPTIGNPPFPMHLIVLLNAVTRTWATRADPDHDISTWCVCGQLPLP
jgi:hypothetical protein